MRKRCFKPQGQAPPVASPKRAGQAILEYAILIGLVVAVVMAMQVYAKRGIQAGVKVAADRLSPFGAADPDGRKAQVLGAAYESGERTNRAFEAGKVLERQSKVTVEVSRTVVETQGPGGSRTQRTPVDQATTRGALDGGASFHSKVVADVD